MSNIIQNNFTGNEAWKNANPRHVFENIKTLLKKRWDEVAKYDHCKLGDGGNKWAIFKRNGNTIEGTRHTLYLNEKYCTCGRWQEFNLPCVHFVVYVRQMRCYSTFEEFLEGPHIHDMYRQGSAIQCYAENITPVATTLITSDGKTVEPKSTARAGRPKKKRIRSISKVTPSYTKKRVCSNCKEEGHNIRTCPFPPSVD